MEKDSNFKLKEAQQILFNHLCETHLQSKRNATIQVKEAKITFKGNYMKVCYGRNRPPHLSYSINDAFEFFEFVKKQITVTKLQINNNVRF